MSKFLLYTTQTGSQMRARIVATHDNGDYTVEPWFYQENGRDTGLCQGGHQFLLEARFVDCLVEKKG
jgi:hypothetical protein